MFCCCEALFSVFPCGSDEHGLKQLHRFFLQPSARFSHSHQPSERLLARGHAYRPFLRALFSALDPSVETLRDGDGSDDDDGKCAADEGALHRTIEQLLLAIAKSMRQVTLAHDDCMAPLIGFATLSAVPVVLKEVCIRSHQHFVK